jgi:ATP synthase I chain
VQAETIQTPNGMIDLARAEARLPRWMLVLGAAGMLAGGVMEGPRFAAGLALGAALSILNYYWLHQVIVALASAGQARVPRLVVAKFALRYPLAIGGLSLLYMTGWLPLAAILAGLFVPVAGVLAEAVVQLCYGWRAE